MKKYRDTHFLRRKSFNTFIAFIFAAVLIFGIFAIAKPVSKTYADTAPAEKKVTALVALDFNLGSNFLNGQGDHFPDGNVELVFIFGKFGSDGFNWEFNKTLMPNFENYAKADTFYMEDVHPQVYFNFDLPISFFTGGFDKRGDGFAAFFGLGNAGYGYAINMEICDQVTNEIIYYTTSDEMLDNENYYKILSTDIFSRIVSFADVELPPAPEVPHYVFNGWYVDSALTIPFDNTMIFDDYELFPKYTINRYTVTFNTVGGTPINPVTQDALTKISIPSSTYYGYKFTGWYIDAEYTAPYDFDSALVGNITLYAKWSLKVYTVTLYDINRNVLMRLTVPHGANLKLAIAEAQKKINFVVSDSVDLDTKIEDDVEVDVVIKLGLLARAGNAIDKFFARTWIWWVVGISIAVAGVVVILITKFSGKKGIELRRKK